MTRAIILAAGQGTRLRPLTNTKPKCLVPFLGISLLERQIQTLHTCGIQHIHVVGGYCVEQIQALGYSCSVNLNYATTNMVSTLFSAQDYIKGNDDLIISYGDIIYQPNNLQTLLANQDEIAIMVDINWREYWELRFADPLSDAETLLLDAEGYITELGKKPHSYQQIQAQYTGLIKVRADRLAAFINFYQQLDPHATYDNKDFANMYFTSFLQALIDHNWKIKAIPVKNGWLEVDSVEDLYKYEQLAAEGKLQNFYTL